MSACPPQVARLLVAACGVGLIALAGGCPSWPAGRGIESLLPGPENRPTTPASTASDKRRLEALRSPIAQQRLEAVRAWKDARPGTLPSELIDLRTDPDARVRAAVMGVLAAGRPARASEYLVAALEDHDLSVRSAAVGALGELGGAEAQEALEKVLKTEGEVLRAGAVAALARLNAWEPVLNASNDRSWRVRLAVARALASCPDHRSAAVARKLLDDPSAGVQQGTVHAVAAWPIQMAGPILLEAMGKNGYLARKTAATQLAARWPPAEEFLVDGPAERRAEVLARLRARFQAEIGHTAEVAASATSDQQPAATAAVYTEPADSEALRVSLDRLEADEVFTRRRAARELAEAAAQRPLSPAAVARLYTLSIDQTDPLVWEDLLAAVANQPEEPAAQLAYAGTRQPAPEVRRRACQYLAAHPDRRHVPVLVPLLEDPNATVAGAAAWALAAIGHIDDTQPIRRLLSTGNELLSVEAAAALAKLGDPEGSAALERLAHSADPAVRRRVAFVIGEVPQRRLTAVLIRLLDDRPDVRRAALESLPRVTGYDAAKAAGQPTASPSEQAALWKQWFADSAPAQP